MNQDDATVQKATRDEIEIAARVIPIMLPARVQ